MLTIDASFSRPQPTVLPEVPLTDVTLNGRAAMEHRRRANGLSTRELILKGDILIEGNERVPEAAAYTRIRYVNLPEGRAKVADSIIDTIRSLTWQ
jgi:hypothetical protein